LSVAVGVAGAGTASHSTVALAGTPLNRGALVSRTVIFWGWDLALPQLSVADQVRGTEWGAHYVQIVAELAQWPTDTPETQVDPSLMSSLGRIESMVQRCVPDLPVVVVQRRMQMVRGYIAYTLSGWIRLNGPVTADNVRAFRQQVDTLSDFLAAGLSGPAPQRRATRAQWPAASFGLNSASTATTP
jgi:hypothetical protein